MLQNIRARFIAVLTFLFNNTARDAFVCGAAWAVYWVVRTIRTAFHARWGVQGLIRSNLAVPLSWGLGLDLIWGLVRGEGPNGNPVQPPWWLNWSPVIWAIGPWWGKVLVILGVGVAFVNALLARLHVGGSGGLGSFLGLLGRRNGTNANASSSENTPLDW